MSIEVVMPRAGLTMVEGTITTWKVAEGEQVTKGQVLMEYENEKNIIEYESLDSGFIHLIAQEGDTVEVGGLIAVIAETQDELAQVAGGAAPAAAAAPAAEAAPAAAPAGAGIEVAMPRAGLTMVEGTITTWKVAEGDTVSKGQVLMEYENEKNMIEYESLEDGIIHLVAQEGDTVEVGGLIAIIAKDQAEYEAIKGGAAPAAAGAPTAAAPAKAAPAVAAPVAAARPAGARVSATGLAKKMAQDAGIDIALVAGSGIGGRIRGRDVEAFLKNPPVQAAAAAIPEEDEITEIPWTGVRAAIARNMYNSVQSTAQCTMVCETDATKLLALREDLKADAEYLGVKITVNDLLCMMLGKVMKKHPMANATFDGKTLFQHKHVDLSVAVATEDGLMVPVVKRVDTMTLTEISKKVKDLAQRAKDKTLTPDESTGACTTITNVGMFPIHAATPILNPPQVTIVGFGQPQLKPVVLEDGSFAAHSLMNVFITVDHRVLDGMMAGRILKDIKFYIEHPEMILA